MQQRGAAIIKARGQSSAASAANAVVDTVRSLVTPDALRGLAQRGGLLGRVTHYGVEAGPHHVIPRSARTTVETWEIVDGVCRLTISASARIDASVAELKEEKSLVAGLLPG